MINLNDKTKTILTIIGGLGLCYGLYIYLNATDFVDKSINVANFIPLTIIVVVIWVSAIMTLKQTIDIKTVDIKTSLNPLKFWGTIFNGTPKWVIVLAIASFIFGIVNFGLLFSDLGVTGIIDGKYVIHNHGKIIRELTEEEFILAKVKQFRAIIAGHIVFLGMGTGILYPRKSLV